MIGVRISGPTFPPVQVITAACTKAEELLDLAATAFVQAAVITWTGGNVGPLIRTPIIK